MSPKINENVKKKTKKNSPLLRILLYVAFLLFMFWLLFLLYILFFYKPEKTKEKTLMDDIYFEMKTSNPLSNFLDQSSANINSTDGSSDIEDESKAHFDLLENDEFQPSMKDLLRERELSINNIDEIFGKIESPKEIEASHSTYGTDVLYIYHSHSRESFLPYLRDTEKPEDAYHSKANITYVGEMLGRALEKRGLGTTVDSTDIVEKLESRKLDYTSSYDVSGEIVNTARDENSKLEIFLDIHRDSLRKESTTVKIQGANYARLLFVVGTGHEDFEKNLTFVEGLNKKLEAQYPGLSKGILQKDGSTGNGIYNQDISPNSVIVEVGGVDNTVEELHRTTEALADVISDYYWHR